MAKRPTHKKNAERVQIRVFLTGLGSLCPLGVGIGSLSASFWQTPHYAREEAEPADTSGALRVPEFDLADFIATTRPYLDRHSEFALAAGAMALGASNDEEGGLSPQRSGVATATVFGNVASMETFQEIIHTKGMRLASPVLFPHCYPNTSNSLLCIEFGLRGYNQNFCGDLLCSGRAVGAGFEAIRTGRADLMLAGGCDALSDRMREILQAGEESEGPPVGEGACLLALENEHSMSERGAQPICEIPAVASRGTGVAARADSTENERRIETTIVSVIERALREANMWEGDVGAVFLVPPCGVDKSIAAAADKALSSFWQLPTFLPLARTGQTYAAAFPLQCTAAALVLSQGVLPSVPRLENVRKGVEMWVEQMPSGMLGDAALVLGWSHRHVIGAILKSR